jgi:NAD-dependent SIR2 family protein deacetylase|tara:strand:+ start:228 stop:458 length:231 start_codon:yes stop_codon:yes gene_type:complete
VNLESVITKLLRNLNKQIDTLSISVTSGNVDSMEKYKYIIGQITALEAVKQEISILLNDKEQNNGTVIDIQNKRDT